MSRPVDPQRARLLAVNSVLGLLALAGLWFCAGQQRHRYENRFRPGWIYEQRLKLPDSGTLKVLTLGYDALYADFLWLRAIQAFGSKWVTKDKTMEGPRDFFDKMTDLDPHFIQAYELSNLVIADNGGDFDRSLSLIDKGITKNFNNYQIPYLGLYTCIWNMNDMDRGRYYALQVNRLPDTPEHIKRLREYIERRAGRFEVAYDINLGYVLDYFDRGDEATRGVMWLRMKDILDRWNLDQLRRATDRYVAEKGEAPASIEQVVAEKYLPPYRAPTLDRLEKIIRSLPAGSKLKPHHDRIRDESYDTIKGLPPDPYGTWYYVRRDLKKKVLAADVATTESLDMRFAYIDSVRTAFESLDSTGMAAQGVILAYQRKHGDKQPPPANMARFDHWDGLGGHFVYDRKENVFYSTSGRRIVERRDPRCGLHGFPPWPLAPAPAIPGEKERRRLAPEMSIWDFPEDAAWAISKDLEPFIEPWEVTMPEAPPPPPEPLTTGGGYTYDERDLSELGAK